MQQASTFTVYNASAGSGKTFTLVKEYLKILLQSEDLFMFQRILAITFTNKAAGEMKERVLKNLQEFGNEESNDLLTQILKETSLTKEHVQRKSKKIVEVILQNYAAFSITTIDSFTHKIVKSFAFDLGLPLNFEVEMDAVSMLAQSVDLLVSKIGNDKDITRLLIKFALSKTDEDKSWDISRELNDISRILLSEDDAKHFRRLKTKSLEDFTALHKELQSQKVQLTHDIKQLGSIGLALIENQNLEHKNFIRATFPKFLVDLSEFSKKFDYKKRSETIDKAIAANSFYTKSASPEVVGAIETILPELIKLFQTSKAIYGQLVLCELTLKSIIPLAVLNHINSELSHLKEEHNIRLNAEFNQLISDHIKQQPTPFIYERIGQRFTHYFIDEMQDTSVLQWNNLIPLIGNALAQEDSQLLLVGDGKQAIYRWRGGKAEQFINLGTGQRYTNNPFSIEKETKTLSTNYRSYSEIIQFNNQFFQHVASLLNNPDYQELFIDGNQQLENKKQGGYVQLDFVPPAAQSETPELRYPERVLEHIQQLKTTYDLSEICVLVRKKSDGIAVANYLAQHEIPIVSSETLLLASNEKVRFITNILQCILYPSDKETLLEVLFFLYQHLKIPEDKHSFFSRLIRLTHQEFFDALQPYNIQLDLSYFNQLPFYEKMEELIRVFSLSNNSDAYVQFFLDTVLEQQRKDTDIQQFLEFWERKKESLSIVAPENANAVQVMTIHKSKGLEFPVVIFPCDLDIYQQINPKIWLDQLPPSFGAFKEILIPFNKELNFISEHAKQRYDFQREELELDNFNLLYVALTRPVEQLYIITEKRIGKTGENLNYYSGLFINFLKQQQCWNDEQTSFEFGTPERLSTKPKENTSNEEQELFISSPWHEHNIQMLASASKLWDTKQEEAVKFGNLLHEMLSKIFIPEDITPVVNTYEQQGLFLKSTRSKIKDSLEKIVAHPQLQDYFKDANTVFNERELVTVDKQIIIPDRLVRHGEGVVIIDYKTGKPSKQYHQQLLKYAHALQTMGYTIHKKLLVYIDEEILVEEI